MEIFDDLCLLYEAFIPNPPERFFFSGLLILLACYTFPRKILAWAAHRPLFAPNCITLWRLPLAWIGIAMFFDSHPEAGCNLIVASLGLDKLDGVAARATGKVAPPIIGFATWRHFWRELTFAGISTTGKWLDPLVDKLTILPVLTFFGLRGYVPLSAVIVMILIELFGTYLRANAKQMKIKVKETAASGFGKVKVALQIATMFLCLCYDQRWLVSHSWILDLTTIAALIFAVLSVVSRMSLNGSWSVVSRIARAIAQVLR